MKADIETDMEEYKAFREVLRDSSSDLTKLTVTLGNKRSRGPADQEMLSDLVEAIRALDRVLKARDTQENYKMKEREGRFLEAKDFD